ncbi:ACT domain-containing protein [Thermotomaculum hydrothermale]|uniref:ACT domain-containing protein n=1 Tax=Thermotomaculum hydrothermale TaxID=981385 RepID=UPI0038B61225
MITVFGESKPGIVAGITSVLAENNVDITDIAQTLLGKNFAMIIIVDLSLCSKNFTELKEVLIKKGEELGVAVFSQHKELFKSMHRI